MSVEPSCGGLMMSTERKFRWPTDEELPMYYAGGGFAYVVSRKVHARTH